MKLVISLILNVIFAIALIVSLSFLRDENYRKLAAHEKIEALNVLGRSLEKENYKLHSLEKENYELQAELEKNIAARSRLKEMLAEARRSAPKPTTLFSERSAKKSATKPNASQEQ